jgi:hypothetical protein
MERLQITYFCFLHDERRSERSKHVLGQYMNEWMHSVQILCLYGFNSLLVNYQNGMMLPEIKMNIKALSWQDVYWIYVT